MLGASSSSHGATPSAPSSSSNNARQQQQVLMRRRRRPAPFAKASETATTAPSSAPAASASSPPSSSALDLPAKAAFLRQDLPNLFNDTGIDASAYADRVEFLDPITRYASIRGYMANIAFLRRAFSPEPLAVHGLRRTSESEITSRWTMTMRFSPARLVAGGKFWDPRVEFTGTSAYGFDAATGKIVRHVDTWDSVENQNFFSVEAFGDFLRQMGNVRRTPAGLEQPPGQTLRRHATFTVRRYAPFVVAEAPLDGVAAAARAGGGQEEEQAATDEAGMMAAAVRPASAATNVNPAGRSVGAFRALAGYLFGGNARGAAMKMTTPVLSDSRGRMQFVLPAGGNNPRAAASGNSGGSSRADASAAPPPLPGSGVDVRVEQGGVFVVREFSGVATPAVVAAEASALRRDAAAAGFAIREDGSAPVRLARYNDPSVKPRFRRNEVMLPLDEGKFDLWRGGPGEGAPEL